MTGVAGKALKCQLPAGAFSGYPAAARFAVARGVGICYNMGFNMATWIENTALSIYMLLCAGLIFLTLVQNRKSEGIGAAITDILPHRPRKEDNVLRYNGNGISEVLQ